MVLIAQYNNFTKQRIVSLGMFDMKLVTDWREVTLDKGKKGMCAMLTCKVGGWRQKDFIQTFACRCSKLRRSKKKIYVEQLRSDGLQSKIRRTKFNFITSSLTLSLSCQRCVKYKFQRCRNPSIAMAVTYLKHYKLPYTSCFLQLQIKHVLYARAIYFPRNTAVRT